MWRDPLSAQLERQRPALGLYIGSVEFVELAAHLGFDWFMIDQMFTGNDWTKTEELIRAGEAYGITPTVRVQAHPWAGYDHRVVVDVARAYGIGAQYVMVSNSGIEEIKQCAQVTHDWHRRAMTIHPFSDFGEWDPANNQVARQSHLIPQPETRGALDAVPETLEVPEVKILFFAMTDASRELSGSSRPDFYNRELWKMVDAAVAQASRTGKAIGANTSYAYDLSEMKKRVVTLHQRGVRMIMIQGATFLFQLAIGDFIRSTREAMRLD